MSSRLFIWISIGFFVSSCASMPVSFLSADKSAEVYTLASEFEIELLRRNEDASTLQKLLARKIWDETTVSLAERAFKRFRMLESLKAGVLLVPPYSKATVNFPSVCLDVSSSVPADNEAFVWQAFDLNIPYYSDVMRKYGGGSPEKSYEVFQELVWNLKRQVAYDDYPIRLQEILKSIDPSPEHRLPTRIKRKLVGIILGDSSENYITFDEIRSALQPSSKAADGEFGLASIGGGALYATSISSGASSQRITFFNPGSHWVEFDPVSYLLRPIRAEVQRIGIAANSSLAAKLQQSLLGALKDAIIRNSEYWYAGRLSSEERAFIRSHPIEAMNAYAQAQKAILSTRKHFGRNEEDDESDAFRHFIWAGLLVRELGAPLAKEFLDAHESLPANASRNEVRSSEMDQKNNSLGLEAAGELPLGDLTLASLEQKARDAIRSGDLVVLESKGKGMIYH